MVRVAVAQVDCQVFSAPETLDEMEMWCEQAQKQDVEFLVLLETYIGGYPKGLQFCAKVGLRTAEERDEFLRYWLGDIEIPGPETDRIGSFAATLKAYLVDGIIEPQGGTLFCTAVYFGPDGQLLGKHRKLMSTASERLSWECSDRSIIQVTESSYGRFGTTISWENYVPSLRIALYAQGIRLWCAPTADDRDVWQATMRHIANEGRCLVLSACQYATRANAPDQYACIHGNAPETVLIQGGSVIVLPLGEILAGPLHDTEGFLVTNIDTQDCER